MSQFVEEKAEMDEAAALIERCWRGFWGRRKKNELLYARETEQRQNQVRHILRARRCLHMYLIQ